MTYFFDFATPYINIIQWTKGCILPLPKNDDLGIITNYRSLTHTFIAAKVYNARFLNPYEIWKWKNPSEKSEPFRGNRSISSAVGPVESSKEFVQKISRQHYCLEIFPRYLIPFTEERWSKYFSHMFSPPTKTDTAVIMLYKNQKSMVGSSDGDTGFFDIVIGVWPGDKLAHYLFIICLDYLLRTSIDLIKEHGFTLKKARSKRYPAVSITDTGYIDDLAFLSNTPADSKRHWSPCECK